MEDEEKVHGAMGQMKLEEDEGPNGAASGQGRRTTSSTSSRRNSKSPSASRDDVKADDESASTPEESAMAKISRKHSQKGTKRAAPLFDHFPDMTGVACGHFQVINDCLYGSKHMGSSEHDALDCDCSPEYEDGENNACGEDSDCINRATKMECVSGDCNCGDGCQNQRFQRKQYADVSVIKTEKKGFGLRANGDLQPNDFIFEYIGEVINEPTFRRRMLQYDEEGIKHFYFMSLTKSEFVDATRKGNLGRFCNHSCNPNCYVDKWVVGEKLRMGIFALRKIKAGEELVFNYNVDRYGADPQPCYCGELNCTGFIGGKTQTERATKLSTATIEALGIEDGDGWDTAVAKKPRKKRPNEDDEEYVNSLQPRTLDEDGVTKVMASLMQCKEKWIAVKLLERLQKVKGDRVRHRVVRMHGYQILKTALTTWMEDDNVVLQVLDILSHLPRLTKNKISDAKIEATVETLTSSQHEDVAAESRRLLDEWSKLETAYRIPRKKVDPNVPNTTISFEERRNQNRDEEPAAMAPSSLKNVVIPKGPKNSAPQRNLSYPNGPPRQRRPQYGLPAGWFAATDPRGHTYFYDRNGTTTWHKPTTPAFVPPVPKGPTRAQQESKALQDIIDSLTKEPTPRASASQTPQPAGTPAPELKKEKWRSLPLEKQQKIYENTLSPHVRYVMDKFRHKLPREDLKKFAKEVSKKLVTSDYKNNRVEDPTTISTKQEKKVKKYVKEYLDKAVEKYKAHERKKAERAPKEGVNGDKTADHAAGKKVGDERGEPSSRVKPEDEDIDMTDNESDESIAPSYSSDRKRKREDEEGSSMVPTESETPFMKRLKEDDGDVPSPPPPPPPPPENTAELEMTEEERCMREQEEALMRENEEAQRLEDEAKLKEGDGARYKNLGARDNIHLPDDDDGGGKKARPASASATNKEVSVQDTELGNTAGGFDGDDASRKADGMAIDHEKEPRKTEVMSH